MDEHRDNKPGRPTGKQVPARECRIDSTVKMLEQVRSTLTDLRNKLSGIETAFTNNIREALDTVDRTLREFDVRVFFVVCIGHVKAGKSTLVNLLSRFYVSPTGFGVETTKRPVIIMAGEAKVCERYFPKNLNHTEENNPAEEDKRTEESRRIEEAFEHAMDHIRGIRTWEEIEHTVVRQSEAIPEDGEKARAFLEKRECQVFCVIGHFNG